MSAVKELSIKTGISQVTIYKYAKQLGRLPTVEELMVKRKVGRPAIYVKEK